MYQFCYEDILAEDPFTAKEQERRLFDRSLELMKIAQTSGPHSREHGEAASFTTKIWSAMIDDLLTEQNGLPDELRAKLISIGLFIMRELAADKPGAPDDYQTLIEITQVIRDGL